jgi:aldose 1-epimerase
MSITPRRPDLRPGRPRFVNSGRFTPMLIAVLCLVLVAISWERGRGNFHRLTSAYLTPAAVPAAPTGPGGEEVIHLVRTPDATASQPEFLTATLLPGRGLNILQLTAQIPGHGEVPLFMSPPLDQASAMLTGTGPDANGAISASMGAAFLTPWAGHLVGRPTENAPGMLQLPWLGQRLTFPAQEPGSTLSTLGLLLNRGADSFHSDVILDGQSVEATYHPGTFSGNWPSTGSVHILAELTGHAMDLTVTVQNTGASPMPVGIGWLPYLNIASHDRARASLVIPSTTRLETNRSTGIPTGRMVPVYGTSLDFVRARGTALGRTALDETFVRLTTPVLSNGPVAELRDTAWGYGVRILPLTANIKALRVIAPADKSFVAIGPYTNFEDPLGPEWDTSEGSGIATLQPGDSVQWKVRVEIFTFTAGDDNPAT